MTHRPTCKLSICIATFNRAAFIGETLDRVISQSTGDCEIIVSDNASTDNTEEVVAQYARRTDRLHYFRHDTNMGLDRNFDSAVERCQGEYCWLMSDDDWLKPGAITRVLETLSSRDLCLLIVNMELRDFSMSKVVRRRWINFESNRLYERGETDRLFVELDHTLWNIGNVIVNRNFWLSRDRVRYYGSWFIHVGVIFQDDLPGDALVIADPLITYRLGNVQSASSMWTELFLHKWPSLVDSLALSNYAKEMLRTMKPWRNAPTLLWLRSKQGYSMDQYRAWIRPRLRSSHECLLPVLVALLPRVLANALGMVATALRMRSLLSD